jgi:hypothetical protein
MRDIITTATVKMMRWMREKGLSVPALPSAEEVLRDKMATERDGL